MSSALRFDMQSVIFMVLSAFMVTPTMSGDRGEFEVIETNSLITDAGQVCLDTYGTNAASIISQAEFNEAWELCSPLGANHGSDTVCCLGTDTTNGAYEWWDGSDNTLVSNPSLKWDSGGLWASSEGNGGGGDYVVTSKIGTYGLHDIGVANCYPLCWVPQIHEELIEFSVTVKADNNAAASVAAHTLTLWFNQNVYQCEFTPTTVGETYTCDASSSLIGCDTTSDSDGAKVLFQNGNADASILSKIWMTTNVATYAIAGQCVPASDEGLLGNYYVSTAKDNDDALCDTGYAHYAHFCVDTDDCTPHEQVLYFDTTQPDVTIDNALWEDGREVSVTTTTDFECGSVQVLCEGHYGVGGDDDTMSDPDLQWCCMSCNCKDLGDKLPDDQCDFPNCPTIANFVWEDLMNSATGKPEVEATLSIEPESLTLTIDVEADYLGNSAADNNGFVYGTTYVIDFEDFNAHEDSIKEPGTCQNRADVFGSVSDWPTVWQYSETPNEIGNVGSENYLAYPPGNKWDVAMDSDDLCTVTYSASFTWDELTGCTGYAGTNNGLYISTADYESNITLSGTLYINVVSPYDFGGDFGFYRVYQLLSQPFQIVVSKTVFVLGDVGINLLNMDIIAVYKEDDESTFRLVVLTESAQYLRLSRDNLELNYAQVFDASDPNNAVTSDNFETITTAVTDGNCLQNKDYICSQLWEIRAQQVKCTEGGIFTDFSGTYSIQFEAECRPEAEMPRADAADKAELFEYCETWLGDHVDEIVDANAGGKVLLQATLSWKDEICDPEVFEVDFAASMEFYIDGYEDAVPDTGYLYQVGVDTVYVKVSTSYPTTHFDVFDTELKNVWICTFDPLNGPDAIGYEEDLGGCYSPQADDNSNNFAGWIYNPSSGEDPKEGFELDTVRDGLTSAQLQFQFDVPDKVARDTLYIHAEIEISLTSGGQRRRMAAYAIKETNQMDHFVDRVGIGSPSDDIYKPVRHREYPVQEPQAPVQQPWVISLQSPWVVAIGGLLALVLTVNCVFMCYTNCVRPNQGGVALFGRRRSRYSPVKGTDRESEYDEASEHDAINVVSD